MGVLNVTPDSFSDGGAWLDADAAVAHGLAMAEAGATIVDVGGESTRPGAEAVGEAEELRRVVPVVEALARAGGPTVSIDTTKLAVAEQAVAAGAGYVNDVSAFRSSPEIADLVAGTGVRCCLMHMRGEPRTMQNDPVYDDVVDEVKAFLSERVEFAVSRGIDPLLIDVDPGIGFGKTAAHSAELLRRLDEIAALGFRVLVGVSRKSFIGSIGGAADAGDRLPGTIAANVLAYAKGARAFRVHDVAEHVQALRIAATVTRDG
ncbi:MAG: dihydropteroate synthase [Baekduia sp.]